MLCGDALATLQELRERPNFQVNTVVTSPPYFHKRNYGESTKEVGWEDSVDAYCDHLVQVFNAVPLHPLGSVWVNVGDKRGSDNQLIRVPHKFCDAMERTGWQLVDEVTWTKVLVDDDGSTDGGCMTEPAPSRLNGNGWEPFYRFVRPPRGQKAWADTCAVRIPRHGVPDIPYLPPTLMQTVTSIEGRNLPNSWRVTMGQTSVKHYAVFPLALAERPIAMTCPMYVNPDGSPVSRIIEMVKYDEGRNRSCRLGKYNSIHSQRDIERSGRNDSGRVYVARKPVTRGFTTRHPDWKPGIVLDPFCGTARTGEVALKLGRSFVGIDLYDENCRISRKRCSDVFEFLHVNSLNPFALAR
jgi:site-specific DNA-methyltransferase (adenine-specific)